jgi:hypothetical protein
MHTIDAEKTADHKVNPFQEIAFLATIYDC